MVRQTELDIPEGRQTRVGGLEDRQARLDVPKGRQARLDVPEGRVDKPGSADHKLDVTGSPAKMYTVQQLQRHCSDSTLKIPRHLFIPAAHEADRGLSANSRVVDQPTLTRHVRAIIAAANVLLVHFVWRKYVQLRPVAPLLCTPTTTQDPFHPQTLLERMKRYGLTSRFISGRSGQRCFYLCLLISRQECR